MSPLTSGKCRPNCIIHKNMTHMGPRKWQHVIYVREVLLKEFRAGATAFWCSLSWYSQGTASSVSDWNNMLINILNPFITWTHEMIAKMTNVRREPRTKFHVKCHFSPVFCIHCTNISGADYHLNKKYLVRVKSFTFYVFCTIELMLCNFFI